MTTWVFVFMGEFGYELLNWHAVIQKLQRLRPGDGFVAASRGGVAALYPGCRYVDIGQVPQFREGVASGYSALADPGLPRTDPANDRYDSQLRVELRRHVLDSLAAEWGWKLHVHRLRGMRFVFSSSRTMLAGGECTFGADPRLFGNVPGEGDIYDALDLRNNFYIRPQPDPTAREAVLARADVRPGKFICVQTRKREINRRSGYEIDAAAIVRALAARGLPVVLISFLSSRALDSYSSFDDGGPARVVTVNGFDEQAWLVSEAAACVFLTEGDFGSHIYVPPLLGRDVHAIAARDIYQIGTTPIDRWNRNVFRHGGRIIPLVAEEVDPDALAAQVAD